MICKQFKTFTHSLFITITAHNLNCNAYPCSRHSWTVELPRKWIVWGNTNLPSQLLFYTLIPSIKSIANWNELMGLLLICQFDVMSSAGQINMVFWAVSQILYCLLPVNFWDRMAIYPQKNKNESSTQAYWINAQARHPVEIDKYFSFKANNAFATRSSCISYSFVYSV